MPAIEMQPTPYPDDYPLAMPDKCLYGWGGETARKLNCPLAFAYTGILTWYAGTAQLCTRRDIMTNLYTVHCAAPGVGKSYTQRRINQALFPGDRRRSHVVTTTMASERGIYERYGLSEIPDKHPALTVNLLQMDEMKEMLNKAAIQNSGLPTTLCTLWGEREISSARKGAVDSAYVQLSILGAVPAADGEAFADAFPAVTQDGLHSRMLIVPGPTSWEFDDMWEPPSEPDDNVRELRVPAPYRPAEPVSVSPAIYTMLKAWRRAASHGGADRGRMGEMMLRVAIIASAINHDKEVTEASMEAALRMGEWQESVRKVYAPSVAENESAKVAGKVLRHMQIAWREAIDGQSPPRRKERPIVVNREIKWGALNRKYGYTEKHGKVLDLAKQALISGGDIEEVLIDRQRTNCFLLINTGD